MQQGEWPSCAPVIRDLYCVTNNTDSCDCGFANMSVDKVTRQVFEI